MVGMRPAVFGSRVRAGRVACAVVPTGVTDAVARLAWGTAGVDAFGMSIDDDAMVPACVLPPGAAAVGGVSALTFVSFPVDETVAKSTVFVCAVVVVADWVVRTG